MSAGMPEAAAASDSPAPPDNTSRTNIRRLGRDALLYGLPTILSGSKESDAEAAAAVESLASEQLRG